MQVVSRSNTAVVLTFMWRKVLNQIAFLEKIVVHGHILLGMRSSPSGAQSLRHVVSPETNLHVRKLTKDMDSRLYLSDLLGQRNRRKDSFIFGQFYSSVLHQLADGLCPFPPPHWHRGDFSSQVHSLEEGCPSGSIHL